MPNRSAATTTGRRKGRAVSAEQEAWDRVADAMTIAIGGRKLVEVLRSAAEPVAQRTLEQVLYAERLSYRVDTLRKVSMAVWGQAHVDAIERILEGEDAPAVSNEPPPWVGDVLAASRGTAESIVQVAGLLEQLVQRNDQLAQGVELLAQTIERRLSA